MTQGRFEETELLLKHSEFVLANLEATAHQFRDDGDFMKVFNNPDGKKLRQFAAEFVTASQTGGQKPVLASNLVQLCEKVSMQMIMPIRTIDYTVYWCKLSAIQLKQLTTSSREFDLRWNLPITLSACKLFSAFCRIVLYLHRITPAEFLVHLFSASSLPKTLPLQTEFDNLLKFVTRSQEKPFLFIEEELKFLRDKLSLLVVNLLPFFSTLFADWTIFDWSLLSIYERNPENTIGQSMPHDEYTLLANISLFQEVLTLFTLVFTSFMDKNQQFALLGASVLTETATFYLSRNYPVPITALLDVTVPSNALTSLSDTLMKSINRKTAETHLHRMKQLCLLAGELENLASLDISHFTRCIHIVRAVAAFAFYEIDLFFRIRDKAQWTEYYVKTVAQLLSSLDRLTQVFIKYKDYIERFFVFNLATADADHLEYLLDSFDLELGSAGGDVILAGRVILDSIRSLDLEKFDSGIRYDFFPLILTHGRALHQQNIISQKLRASYLTPIFEHLMTINMHAHAAQDSTRFYFEACQMHTFWRHAGRFEDFVGNNAAPINDCASFFNVFSYFNYDNIVIPMHKNEMKLLKEVLENKVRTRLSIRLNTVLSTMLSARSRLLSYSLGGDIGQSPPIDNISQLLLENKNCEKEAHDISPICQTNNFISSLPQAVVLFDKRVEIASYFMTRLSNDLIKVLLFNISWNISSVSDASQIVWTFFSQARALKLPADDNVGLVFKKSLLDAVVKNSFFAGQTLTEQANAMLNKAPDTIPELMDPQRLCVSIYTRLNNFINGGHFESKYVHFVQRFVGGKDKVSLQYFKSLFRVLGIHCALYLDCNISKGIVDDIILIHQSYSAVAHMINSDKTPIYTMDSTNRASDALLRLSIALTIRRMIRRATEETIEETVPGLVQLAQTSPLKSCIESELIYEVINKRGPNYFIREMLVEKLKKEKIPGLTQFFTFLAILFVAPKWDDTEFFPEEDALSKNIHLLPLAFDLLVEISPALFSDAHQANVNKSIETFFTQLAEAIEIKKGNSKIDKKLISSYLILIDKFPKLVPTIEYGRMKHVFPYSLLSWSYPKTDNDAKKKSK